MLPPSPLDPASKPRPRDHTPRDHTPPAAPARADAADRHAREAAALRANLRKRKDQARARETLPAPRD